MQRYSVAFRVQLQSVARVKLQIFAQGFGNQDPSGIIEGNCRVHMGLNKWEFPFVIPILPARSPASPRPRRPLHRLLPHRIP